MYIKLSFLTAKSLSVSFSTPSTQDRIFCNTCHHLKPHNHLSRCYIFYSIETKASYISKLPIICFPVLYQKHVRHLPQPLLFFSKIYESPLFLQNLQRNGQNYGFCFEEIFLLHRLNQCKGLQKNTSDWFCPTSVIA